MKYLIHNLKKIDSYGSESLLLRSLNHRVFSVFIFFERDFCVDKEVFFSTLYIDGSILSILFLIFFLNDIFEIFLD